MLSRPGPERIADTAAGAADAYRAQVPLRQAAAAQTGGALLVLALTVLAPSNTIASSDAMTLALLQGIFAAALGRGLGMEAWWIPIHALFVPGLVWMLASGLPPEYALVAFCLLLSLYWGVSRNRVPLFLSSQAAARGLAKLLPVGRSFSFLDLGCGLGGVLASLALERPQGRYFGIESAPVPFLLSWLRAGLVRGSCRVSWGDFNALDLGRYDVVYAYLSPAAMGDLWRKARREMRPGSLLVSNSFAIPGVPATKTIATGTQDGSKLLLWRM
jgi:hypothetical protein